MFCFVTTYLCTDSWQIYQVQKRIVLYQCTKLEETQSDLETSCNNCRKESIEKGLHFLKLARKCNEHL